MLFFCVLAILLWLVMLYFFWCSIFFNLNKSKGKNNYFLTSRKNTSNSLISRALFKEVDILDVFFIFFAVIISFFVILSLLLLTIDS